jgi:hypothetical protein
MSVFAKYLPRRVTTTVPDVRPEVAPAWMHVHAGLIAYGLTAVTPIELANWRGISRERSRQLLVRMEECGMAVPIESGRRGERRLLDGTERMA